jgi:flagellar basal body-associated protein FliL
MKKSGETNYYFWISILVLILITISFGFHYFSLTGKAISPVTIPSDCSESNIKALWDSIFKESSTGIILSTNDSLNNNLCDYIFAMKNISKTYYILFSSNEINNSFLLAKKVTYNSTSLGLSIGDFNMNDPFKRFGAILLMLPSSEEENRTSSIQTPAEANSTFSNTFKIIPNGAWSLSSTYGLAINQELYYFNDTENYSIGEKNFSRGMAGSVYKISLDESIIYVNGETNISSSCTPNWTRQEGVCFANETKVISYSDNNNCGSITGQPATTSAFCDFDLNGVVGDVSSLSSEYNFSVYVSGSQLNNSINYSLNSTLQPVQIRKDGIVAISFNHNFSSSPVDLKNTTIKFNNAGSFFGYIIINGISDEKTVYFDKKNSSSDQICIKDTTISLISNISADCDEDDEYLINCPGSSDGYNCTITNSTFTVIGLEHSAVKEIISTSCSTNWSCSAWSNCTNSTRTRTCTDVNNCNTTSGRPVLNESCNVVAPSCSPMWTCTDWAPLKCSADENQTRTCTDTKKCNTQTGKPSESQICENPTSNRSLILIILGVIAVIIVVVLVILLIRGKKSNQQQPAPSPMQPQYPQPPRPMAPQMPQQTLQQRQFPVQPQQIGQYPAPQPIQQYPPLPTSNQNLNNQPQN